MALICVPAGVEAVERTSPHRHMTPRPTRLATPGSRFRRRRSRLCLHANANAYASCPELEPGSSETWGQLALRNDPTVPTTIALYFGLDINDLFEIEPW